MKEKAATDIIEQRKIDDRAAREKPTLNVGWPIESRTELNSMNRVYTIRVYQPYSIPIRLILLMHMGYLNIQLA